MRIYTNTFDLARICPRRFWVAPYSDFKIGVKIAEKGAPSAKDFAVKAGLTELTPDEDKVDGFTTYTLKSADTGFVEYTIEVEGVSEKLKLVQITTDSTVFEVGGGGGGGDVPADVATKSWVNSQISDFVEEDALTAYAEKADLTAYAEKTDLTSYAEKTDLTAYAEKTDLTSYAEKADLTSYAEKTDLTAYAETADLTAYAAKTDLTSYAEKTDLTAYYTKSETSSAAEISAALGGKQPTGNYLTAETDPAFNAWLSGDAFSIGYGAQAGSRAIAIGYTTKAEGQYSVAIGGPNCKAYAYNSIQLGSGGNNVANTFQVFSYPMLSTDGKIPNERLHLSAVSESDWATLSGSADAGTFYFVY